EGCEALTDESIEAVAANCPALVSLTVHYCPALTDEPIKAIAANCHALKSLFALGCRALTQESMKAIAASFLVPESLCEAWAEHKHNILSEDGTKIDFGAYWDGKERRWAYKYFTETQLEDVTDAFVVSLLSANVTSINLAQSDGITDACVNAIAINCFALESLNVAGCTALTD
ncbi:MAG: hypothetical protein AAFV01_17925, partial [Bacteroidota bacterium]